MLELWAGAGAVGAGEGLLGLLAVLLLGLRHATDPDHLTAVATLAVSAEGGGARRAGGLGLAWGLGHGVTFLGLGFALVALGFAPPEGLGHVAELAIGVVIAALALRLLRRWRRGVFHVHPHLHDGVEHSHPHLHEAAPGEIHGPRHGHDHSLGRSPLAAFGVGLLHGAGGSAAIGVLLLASLDGRSEAFVALCGFAAATVLAMTAVSAGLGFALERGPLARRVEGWVPVFGVASLLFGLWYAAAAWPLGAALH